MIGDCCFIALLTAWTQWSTPSTFTRQNRSNSSSEASDTSRVSWTPTCSHKAHVSSEPRGVRGYGPVRRKKDWIELFIGVENKGCISYPGTVDAVINTPESGNGLRNHVGHTLGIGHVDGQGQSVVFGIFSKSLARIGSSLSRSEVDIRKRNAEGAFGSIG